MGRADDDEDGDEEFKAEDEFYFDVRKDFLTSGVSKTVFTSKRLSNCSQLLEVVEALSKRCLFLISRGEV